MEKSNNIKVSVVIPLFNEEKYIENCIQSLLVQDYPLELMEWIFIDGNSNDNTVCIVEKFEFDYPELIKILHNPQRTAPFAMNIGIKSAKGEFIIRLDAHSEYSPNYISRCVYYLETTDIDNVGGIAETKGKGIVGETIAKMLSSKFGVGNSQFRTSGNSGFVDTVPFGAFRRKGFEKYGLFDERLDRNEDYEINYRIRKNGGKVFMSNDIRFIYYCRDSFQGIMNMAFKNGKWSLITLKLFKEVMGLRHFIPLLFVLSLLILPVLSLFIPLFKWLFVIEIIAYFILDIYFSIKAASNIKQALLLFALFPGFHLSYGVGSIWSIFLKV